jgi:hypothetical protein
MQPKGGVVQMTTRWFIAAAAAASALVLPANGAAGVFTAWDGTATIPAGAVADAFGWSDVQLAANAPAVSFSATGFGWDAFTCFAPPEKSFSFGRTFTNVPLRSVVAADVEFVLTGFRGQNPTKFASPNDFCAPPGSFSVFNFQWRADVVASFGGASYVVSTEGGGA